MDKMDTNTKEIKLYKSRFVMLIIFSLLTMTNNFQWIQYSAISKTVTCYYDTNIFVVNFTSVIYMIVYIIFIFHSNYILVSKGVRFATIMGAFLVCFGAIVKVFSVAPDRFYVAILGTTFEAFAQLFIYGMPPHLASIWFSSESVSTACAVAVFGNQIGCALGFLMPTLMVPDTCPDKIPIAKGLLNLNYIVAAFTTVVFLIIVAVFKDKPPKPPSHAQANILHTVHFKDYWLSVKDVMKNKDFILHLFAYGISGGINGAVPTVLNQVIVKRFPEHESSTGWLGLNIILCGCVGVIVCGRILDTTRKYKETTFVVYLLQVVAMVAYAGVLFSNKLWLLYIALGFQGFFNVGYITVGYDLGTEITYPVPEGTSAGLLNASTQVFGIIMIYASSWVLESYGDILSISFQTVVLAVGVVLTGFIKTSLQRQKTENRSSSFGTNEKTALIIN